MSDTTTNNDKAVTKTVSMKESLWQALDLHAESMGSDRSAYLRSLVEEDLRRSGKLPSTPRADALEMIEALFVAIGPEATKARLEAITVDALSVAS